MQKAKTRIFLQIIFTKIWLSFQRRFVSWKIVSLQNRPLLKKNFRVILVQINSTFQNREKLELSRIIFYNKKKYEKRSLAFFGRLFCQFTILSCQDGVPNYIIIGKTWFYAAYSRFFVSSNNLLPTTNLEGYVDVRKWAWFGLAWLGLVGLGIAWHGCTKDKSWDLTKVFNDGEAKSKLLRLKIQRNRSLICKTKS